MSWVGKYVGTEFDANGFGDGPARGVFSKPAHCWGLIRRAYREERKILLPPYDDINADQMLKMARATNAETASGPWRQVPRGEEVEFDVVLMSGWVAPGGDKRARKMPVHVGLVTPDKQVLHLEVYAAAVVLPFTDQIIAHRYLSSYRYVNAS